MNQLKTLTEELSDIGGRCPWCHESDNWLITHVELDEYIYGYILYTEVVCKTPRICPDVGDAIEICNYEKTIEEVNES